MCPGLRGRVDRFNRHFQSWYAELPPLALTQRCISTRAGREGDHVNENQADVVCVDLTSWPAASAGAGSVDSGPRVLWRYEMTKTLHVMQDHVASCSVLIYGDFLYVSTGNGRYKTVGKPFYPLNKP